MVAAQTSVCGSSMSSLQRGLAILTTITDNGEMSAAALAQQLRLPRSTVYRHLQVLCGFNLIEEDGGLYTPGWKAIGMSGRNLTNSLLSGLAVEILSNVSEALQETAVVTVRAGTHAVCLRQIRGPRQDRLTFRINQLLPLYAGAGQRLLLAHVPRALASAILTRNFAESPDSGADEERLWKEIAWARKHGYQISRAELQEDALALAVPVFLRGEIVCSLTVAGHQPQCDHPEWIERALRVLQANAKKLSERLVAADDEAEASNTQPNRPSSRQKKE